MDIYEGVTCTFPFKMFNRESIDHNGCQVITLKDVSKSDYHPLYLLFSLKITIGTIYDCEPVICVVFFFKVEWII